MVIVVGAVGTVGIYRSIWEDSYFLALLFQWRFGRCLDSGTRPTSIHSVARRVDIRTKSVLGFRTACNVRLARVVWHHTRYVFDEFVRAYFGSCPVDGVGDGDNNEKVLEPTIPTMGSTTLQSEEKSKTNGSS